MGRVIGMVSSWKGHRGGSEGSISAEGPGLPCLDCKSDDLCHTINSSQNITEAHWETLQLTFTLNDFCQSMVQGREKTTTNAYDCKSLIN